MLSNILAWTQAHTTLILLLWPVFTALISLGYHKLDAYPRTHAMLSAMVSAGLDLPSLLADLKRVLTGAPKGGVTLLALALFVSACAGASQTETDSASNFANVTADARCAQAARQAATDASNAMPSDAGPDAANAEKHARHVAAMAAFDKCESQKDGGL